MPRMISSILRGAVEFSSRSTPAIDGFAAGDGIGHAGFGFGEGLGPPDDDADSIPGNSQ